MKVAKTNVERSTTVSVVVNGIAANVAFEDEDEEEAEEEGSSTLGKGMIV